MIVALGMKGVGVDVGIGAGVGEGAGVAEGDGEAVAVGGTIVAEAVGGSSVGGAAQPDSQTAMAMSQDLAATVP